MLIWPRNLRAASKTAPYPTNPGPLYPLPGYALSRSSDIRALNRYFYGPPSGSEHWEGVHVYKVVSKVNCENYRYAYLSVRQLPALSPLLKEASGATACCSAMLD